MSARTCEAVGACQGRRPGCTGCSFHALLASAQASRDTGCAMLFADDADEHTPTPMERISYWFGVGLMTGASVLVFFGGTGYLVAKFLTTP